jgi:antitoxin (DNA-binding transcriptional repressor) of toxin-antitoxin stability system
MTATQVATNMSGVLAAVSSGEIIEVLGEDGTPVARMLPAKAERMADVFGNYPVDPVFATEVEQTVLELRASQNSA